MNTDSIFDWIAENPEIVDELVEISTELANALRISPILPTSYNLVEIEELISKNVKNLENKFIHLIKLIDAAVEYLIALSDYVEEKGGILLFDLTNLINRSVKLLERMPPHLQHHICNNQRRNRTSTSKS